MIEFHKVWIEQCEAARDIREAFGLEKAIGYLVGEKLPELPRGLQVEHHAVEQALRGSEVALNV